MFLLVSRYLVPKGYRGMTVFPFIFVREKQQTTDAIFLNHEKIHIRQQAELLMLVFFVWYFLEFLIKLIKYQNRNHAYRNISFEREAYANEKDLDYLQSRSFWSFLKYV